MANLLIDAMQNPAPWAPLSPDGVTPSVALSVSGDGVTPTPSGDGRSLVATRTAPAMNHRIQRSIAAVDLAPWPELRITLNADVATGARPDSSFFLELRLGSASTPIGAAGNDWHRRLPIEQAGAWETARLSLADLPAPVRAAATQIELRCVSDTSFTARIDQLVAARPSFPADIDDALLSLLDKRVSVGGPSVSAQVISAGSVLPTAQPLILIQPYDLRPASDRDAVDGGPSDFTAGGAIRLRGPSDPFELDYAIEARAATRAEQSVILDFLIGALPRQGTLRVNGTLLRAEWISPPDGFHSFAIERQLIHLRVAAWRERSAPVGVHPVKSVSTIIDAREKADG